MSMMDEKIINKEQEKKLLENNYNVSVWVAALLLTYERIKENNNAEDKVFLKQADIKNLASEILGKDSSSAKTSWWLNADNSKSYYNYLRSKGKLRRLTQIGELSNEKEYPKEIEDFFDERVSYNTIKNISIRELFDWYKEAYSKLNLDITPENILAPYDKDIHYWVYAPGDNASKWEEFHDNNIIGIGWNYLGDLRDFKDKDSIARKMKEFENIENSPINNANATWDFSNTMKAGDIVFAKKGRNKIVGRGIVESDYYYDEEFDAEYPNLRKINWTHCDECEFSGTLPIKTLTDITSKANLVDELNRLYPEQRTYDSPYEAYSSEDFLKEVYMTREEYEVLLGLIRAKKNVILQGAPGVGKTYAAKRLAYSMMGFKDENRVMMIQFHQSYSYEDLIEGYRPTETGFEIKKGSLYNFCKKAAADLEKDYFFIIDEINRGNLSKIFGELFMLIERDKRGKSLHLLYSDEEFCVPENVYIIGMMNTADRSLAMLDYALRRRFAFYEMVPAFESDGFDNYIISKKNDKFIHLINCVKNLNRAISSDDSLGDGFCIGHSYFCDLDDISDRALSNIVEYELIPLLKEYWFDEQNKVRDWSSSLRGVIK